MSIVRPGDILAGKYRVERVLGQGGMGYVIAARHMQLDQLVAIKFLRRSSLDQSEATNRFLREAKAVVRLKNEHVARVSDVGTLDSGELYMVMEYLEGQDLSSLAKQRPQLPPSEAVEYVMQACEGLAEAHALGIVHRDVKLANLFVSRGPGGAPLVKVLDFGVSKTNPFGDSEHEMTRTAAMLGSPRFMSPEQMRDARAVDARSDIWSLGVVLYRLVVDRAPFEAETLGALLSKVMHEPPVPLSARRADLPPGFESIVLRCLEKDPALRFSSVAELAYALAPYAADPARARTAADRIALALGLTHATAMLGAPALPPSSRGVPSGPPGASDTGTAAPWAGTHGGARPRRSPLILASIGLSLVIALFGVGAKLRIGHGASVVLAAARALRLEQAAAQPSPAPTTTATATAIATEPAPPTAPPTATAIATAAATAVETASPPAVVQAALPSPPPTAIAVVPPTDRATAKQSHETELRKRVAPAAAAPAKKPARPKEPSSPAPATKDDGIPATRD